MNTANVLRFGSSHRQLFGLHHPPLASSSGRAVLMCNPFGREAIRSHRLYRVLADRLARSGAHVFRFDYFGTGDSDGDDVEVDLDAWIEDVRRSDELLCHLAGVPKCTWFGLRLGGTMAALASVHGERTPDRLVLLDPVVDGAGFLEELSRVHAGELADLQWHRRGNLFPEAEPKELLGFPVTAAFRDRLRSLGLDDLVKARARTIHLIETASVAYRDTEHAAWEATGANVSHVVLDVRIEWTSIEAMNTAVAPIEILQALVGAIEAAK